MSTLVRIELSKLRSLRPVTVTLVATAAFAALVAAATASTAGVDGNAPLGSAGNLERILRGSSLAPLAAFVLGVIAMAGEYQHRTITQTFLAVPRRGRVIAAKLAAAAVAGVALAAAGMIVGVTAAAPVFVTDGAALDIDAGNLLSVAVGTLVVSALAGAAGVAVGALTRTQTAAIVGSVVWLLLGEGIIAALAGHGVAQWLPGFAAQAAAGANDELPMAAGAVLFAAYGLGVAAVATRWTVSKDVS